MAELLTITNGWVQGTSIAGVPLVRNPIKLGTRRAYPGQKLRKYTGITVHDTGNAGSGADAMSHARWTQRLEDGTDKGHAAGAHFYVDDKRAVQLMPITDMAWHAGDGHSGVGNNEYLAIEMCINRDRDKTRSERNTQVIVASLLATLGGEIKKHQDFSGKPCPGTLLSRWSEFKGIVMGLRDAARKEQSVQKKTDHLDEAQRYLVDNALMKDERWSEPITRKEVAWVIFTFIRRWIAGRLK